VYISIFGALTDSWFIYLTHSVTLVTIYTTCCDIRNSAFWPHQKSKVLHAMKVCVSRGIIRNSRLLLISPLDGCELLSALPHGNNWTGSWVRSRAGCKF